MRRKGSKNSKKGLKTSKNAHFQPLLVEVTGLEPTTSWSLTKRATKLRYTSLSHANSISYYNN